eukprot:360571-Lingulodinium_polyedra.AAC.1
MAYAEAYRPFEVTFGQPYGAPADVWAAGYVVRELIAGRMLWREPLAIFAAVGFVCGEPTPQTEAWGPRVEARKSAGRNALERSQRDSAHAGAAVPAAAASFLDSALQLQP